MIKTVIPARREPRNNWQGRAGLSAECTLDKMVLMGILLEGREHPCDGCNMDRGKCHGFPRADSGAVSLTPVPGATKAVEK